VEVAWFAQCDNPKNNDPSKCLERYTPWSKSFSEAVVETPPEAQPAGFGSGNTFEFRAPDGLLTEELEVSGNTIHYGTSYVYFAACAGQLVPVDNATERLPVACQDRTTKKRLDQRHFVVGVTTLYGYDLVSSRNPEPVVYFGEPSVPSCSGSTSCSKGFECSAEGQCIPVVSPCSSATRGSCDWHCLNVLVPAEGFNLWTVDGTPLPAPRKAVWIKSYTNAGEVDSDGEQSLPVPPQLTGTTMGTCVNWRAPSSPTEHAHVWLVVRDNRGGLAVRDQRIIVR
jgi:hypothetical protein